MIVTVIGVASISAAETSTAGGLASMPGPGAAAMHAGRRAADHERQPENAPENPSTQGRSAHHHDRRWSNGSTLVPASRLSTIETTQP